MTTEFRGGEDSRSIVGPGIYVDSSAKGRELEDMPESKIVEKTNSSVSFVVCSGHAFQNSLH